MPITGKKLEPAELERVRGDVARLAGIAPCLTGDEQPWPKSAADAAVALLAHADWLQSEIGRHISMATATLDKRGIRIEVIENKRSAVGVEVIVTDPRGDENREIETALNLVLMLAGDVREVRAREAERTVMRTTIDMLLRLNRFEPGRLLAALDYLSAEAKSVEPRQRGRIRASEKKERAMHAKLARMEDEARALRAVLFEAEKEEPAP